MTAREADQIASADEIREAEDDFRLRRFVGLDELVDERISFHKCPKCGYREGGVCDECGKSPDYSPLPYVWNGPVCKCGRPYIGRSDSIEMNIPARGGMVAIGRGDKE